MYCYVVFGNMSESIDTAVLQKYEFNKHKFSNIFENIKNMESINANQSAIKIMLAVMESCKPKKKRINNIKTYLETFETEFPEQVIESIVEVTSTDPEIEFVSEEYIKQICYSLSSSEPEENVVEIFNLILREANQCCLEGFVWFYTKCLKEGIFPDKLKEHNIFSLSKKSKKNSYRPLCAPNTLGKILERIISDRLRATIKNSKIEVDNYYIYDEIEVKNNKNKLMTAIAKKVREAFNKEEKYCAIVHLDVKNAYHTAKWDKIMEGLQKFEAPTYLKKIILSYAQNRRLNTSKESFDIPLKCGLIQGSELSPLLWFVMYVDLFISIPGIFGLSDDCAFIVEASTIDDIKNKANQKMEEIKAWMENAKLSLSDEKTKAVLMYNEKYTPKEEMNIVIEMDNIFFENSIDSFDGEINQSWLCP